MTWTSPDHLRTLLLGDCLERLAELPDEHFHCCVTSPPYYRLRRYLDAEHPEKAKEIGSEPTPAAFIETMVAVFREVRRVLRSDGLLWVNLGDSMGGDGAGQQGNGQRRGRRHTQENLKPAGALPDGQLANIPHRVAEALRQDGWRWRQTIVWAKPSPLPESIGGWRWERCRVKVGSQSDPRQAGGYAAGANDVRYRPGSVGVPGAIPECYQTTWRPAPAARSAHRTTAGSCAAAGGAARRRMSICSCSPRGSTTTGTRRRFASRRLRRCVW